MLTLLKEGFKGERLKWDISQFVAFQKREENGIQGTCGEINLCKTEEHLHGKDLGICFLQHSPAQALPGDLVKMQVLMSQM